MAVRLNFDADRAVAAVVYLASKNVQSLTKYKICKLLVLADKHHLVRHGRTITGDRLCAMEHGPIPSQTLNFLDEVLGGGFSEAGSITLASLVTVDRRYRFPHFLAAADWDHDALSVSDIESLDATIQEHGSKNFDELKALTHEMYAYKRAWNERPNDAPLMALEDLFEEDAEAVEGALEEMVEDDQLRKAFGVL